MVRKEIKGTRTEGDGVNYSVPGYFRPRLLPSASPAKAGAFTPFRKRKGPRVRGECKIGDGRQRHPTLDNHGNLARAARHGVENMMKYKNETKAAE